MKHILLTLIAILVTLIPFNAHATDRVFKGISDIPGVSTTYIGGAVLKIAKPYIGRNMEYASNVKSVEIVESDIADSTKQVLNTCNDIIESQSLELVFENIDDGTENRIYVSIPDKNGKSDTILIIEVKDDIDINAVYIKATIDISELLSKMAYL